MKIIIKSFLKQLFGAIVIFAILEIATRILWNPLLIGEKLYRKVEPTYDFGFNNGKELFYKNGDRFVCCPSPNYGFYKQFLNTKKHKNEFRIFVVGASSSRGKYGINYSRYLQDILRQYYPDINWEVNNFSILGWGSLRNFITLKNVIKYRPDLVILNIAGTNEFEDERDLKLKDTINKGFYKFMYKSYFFVIAKKLLFQKLGLQDVASYMGNIENEDTECNKPEFITRLKKTLEGNIIKIMELLRKSKTPAILIGYSIYGHAYKTDTLIDINNIFKKNVALPQVLYFNTQEIIDRCYPEKEKARVLFVEKAHFTPLGHRFIARALFDFIVNNYIENGVIPLEEYRPKAK